LSVVCGIAKCESQINGHNEAHATVIIGVIGGYFWSEILLKHHCGADDRDV